MIKKIYIAVEIKKRELIGDLHIIDSLLDSDYEIIIGSKKSINFILKNKKDPDGVILLTSPPEKIKDYKFLKSKVDKITILDPELSPALTDNEIKHSFNTVKQLIDNEFIDGFYVIGQRYVSIFKKIFPKRKNKVISTGWPRIDAWKNKELIKIDTNLLKKKYGKFLLFSSDFGLLTHNENLKFLEYIKKITKSKAAIKFEEKKLKELRMEFKTIMKLLIEMDKDKKFPKVIIRPHPVENKIYWKKIKKIFKKNLVIGDGEITPWIDASHKLLHRGCTSAIQSHIMGKKSGYLITSKKWLRKSLSLDLSEKIQNIHNLKKFVDQKINLSLNSKIKNYIENNAEKNSSKIIKNHLNSLSPFKKYNDKISFFPKLLYQIKDIKLKLDIKYSKKKFIDKLDGGISKFEINKNLIAIRKKKDFQIKKIINDCYEIKTCV